MKNEYIVKFELKTLYAEFRNDPIGTIKKIMGAAAILRLTKRNNTENSTNS